MKVAVFICKKFGFIIFYRKFIEEEIVVSTILAYLIIVGLAIVFFAVIWNVLDTKWLKREGSRWEFGACVIF